MPTKKPLRSTATPQTRVMNLAKWISIVLISGCSSAGVASTDGNARLSEAGPGVVDGRRTIDLQIETALAATLTDAFAMGRPLRFADPDVPHTEVMISDFTHGCGATSSTGQSVYIELFSSSASKRVAVPGTYAYWRPHLDTVLPSDNRFVAVFSSTSSSGRDDSVAESGDVEVLEADGHRIVLKYVLVFNPEQVLLISGEVEASVCENWEHSWLGVPRTSPAIPRN